MIESLINIDRSISVTLNNAHSSFLDWLMQAVSHKYNLIPLYLGVVIYILCRRKCRFGNYSTENTKRLAMLVIVTCILTVVITDQVSHQIIKPLVKRLRPSFDPYTWDNVRTPFGKGGIYGFVSNHASNFIGFATISALFIRKKLYTFLVMLIACLVCYSRVYLGRHFFGDILGGAVLGFLIASLMYIFVKRLVTKKLRKDYVVHYGRLHRSLPESGRRRIPS